MAALPVFHFGTEAVAEQRRDLTRIARTNRTDIAGVIRDAVNEYVADFRDRLCFVGQK